MIVLRSFDEIQDTDFTRMYNNWAAMFNTCIERIDVARDRVEQAKERFEQRQQETESNGENVDPSQRKEEIAQEIRSIVGSRDPQELEDGERSRVENLRKQYYFYESMEDVEDVEITQIANNAEELGYVMERFEYIRKVMSKKRGEFRRLALGEAIFPEDLVQLSTQYAEFLSSLTDTMAPAKRMKEQSVNEFFDQIRATDEEQLEQMEDSAENIAEQSLVER